MPTRCAELKEPAPNLHHTPGRILHETPPTRTYPSLRPRLPAQLGSPGPRGADPDPRRAATGRGALSANIIANSTPCRATLVFRSSAIAIGLGGLTVPPTGRKEGSQDEKEEEGRQAGIGCRTRGLVPACPRPARPPASGIWASAQSLPAAARGTCPSLWPGGRSCPLRRGARSCLSARLGFSPRGDENTIHKTCSFPPSKPTPS